MTVGRHGDQALTEAVSHRALPVPIADGRITLRGALIVTALRPRP
jgi:hypothetical protein